MPDSPEFPIIDGEERFISPKLDENEDIVGVEFVAVPKDVHGRLIAKRAHENILNMLTKPRAF